MQATDTSQRLARELSKHTQGEVLFSTADRGRYATDASIYQIMPVGAFVPKTDDDVTQALSIARSLKVPIVARGGGTSQCGQTVGAGLVIDYSKYLRNIVSLDLAARQVTVQPGMVLDHLNAALKQHGLWYPVDVSTSAQATLGGMAGNNSCGSRSLAYGNMVHNVVGMNVLTAAGSTLQLGAFASSTGAELALGEYVRGLAAGVSSEIAAHWPRVMRRVAGYNLDVFLPVSERPYTADGSVNLAQLLVGAEGTLGLTTALTLKLSDLPRAKVLGVVNFPTFYGAMDAAQHLVKLEPTAVELVDRTMVDLALDNPAFAPTVRTALVNGTAGNTQALLLVEFSGANKLDLLPKMRQLVELMGDLGLPNSVVQMTDEAPQKNLWEVRKAGLNIMMSLRGDGKPVSFIEDCAVPLDNLAEYTSALTEVFAKHGSRGTWYAHASVGTLHVRPILDMRRQGEAGGAAKMRAIAQEASELVRKYKGAYSGEHGDGLCRGEWIQWQFGPKVNDAFKAIKTYLDPDNLLCPGRMVDMPAAPIPKMDDSRVMRYSSGAAGEKPYTVIPIKTALDWQAWNVQNDAVTEAITASGTGGDPAQGLAKAVEMCNNNGHCRKFDAGTMCPSYRVTRDEKHATRGRANTLRLALSGQLSSVHPELVEGQGLRQAQPERGASANVLSDNALIAINESLDLCVGCKGCKRDCPTGVDMAKMKVEFTHHYKTRFGYTLKDRVIAHLPQYARWAARLAPLLNLRNHIPALAWLGEKTLGLAAQRSLPVWQRQHFFNQTTLKTATLAEALAAPKAVALFVDTFNGYFESENAYAAVQVLQAAGYTVHVLAKKSTEHLCCGRTYLSSGMVEAAKNKAHEVMAATQPLVDKGIAIVGLEPSCLLTLRDEYLTMGLGKAAQTLASNAFLFEEFLIRELKAGRLDTLKTLLKPASKPLLVHGHCHQKAFDAVSPMIDVLRLIPQAQVSLIESSCCGMAGSFGYESEHLAVSMQMAELSLLPAMRKAPDAIVVADGTSCRHQIHDGAQTEALHLAVVLSKMLISKTAVN